MLGLDKWQAADEEGGLLKVELMRGRCGQQTAKCQTGLQFDIWGTAKGGREMDETETLRHPEIIKSRAGPRRIFIGLHK